MLEAAVDWDRRMKQLYDGEYQWLDVKGQTRDPEHYYFQSLVYRFLSLLSIARRFEREAYYINSRIAKEKELEFLRYSKSFIWAMTNPKITPNDDMPGIDHFRHDAFRPVLDLCYENIPELPGAAGGGDIIFDYRRFRAILTASAPVLDEPQNHLDTQGGGVQLVATYRSEIDEVLNFFQGLKPNEPFPTSSQSPDIPHNPENPEGLGNSGEPRTPEPPKTADVRRRWDRLVCLHLLTLGFIGSFGYEWQQWVQKARKRAVSELSSDRVAAKAFLDDIDRMGLSEQKEMRKFIAILERYPRQAGGEAVSDFRDFEDRKWIVRWRAFRRWVTKASQRLLPFLRTW
jgi:hypothetical protein